MAVPLNAKNTNNNGLSAILVAKTKQLFRYQEVKMDLFKCPSSTSFAHCVSTDFEMGRGIAVKFKELFGRVPELLAQNKKIGQTAVLVDGDDEETEETETDEKKEEEENKNEQEQGNNPKKQKHKRWIFYMVTKRNYWGKPSYDTIKAALEDLKLQVVANGITRLAMPKIGCGLDGMSWPCVRRMIHELFYDIEHLVVTVCDWNVPAY